MLFGIAMTSGTIGGKIKFTEFYKINYESTLHFLKLKIAK